MICVDTAPALFTALHELLNTSGAPQRQLVVYVRALRRVEAIATRSAVFLPIDLPLAVARTCDLDDACGLRAAAIATLLWAGADLMDDAADGDLREDEWDVSSHQLALVYTNLLATLPHLVCAETADAAFSLRLAETLWLMSQGQFSDLESASTVHTVAGYFDLIAHKTGAETAFFAAAPLRLAGAPAADCEAWEQVGLHVGCMLQLYSDIHSTFTEGPGNDLLRGKRTLPVLHTLDALAAEERAAFRDDLDRVAGGDAERLPSVFARMYDHGAVRYALGEVERLRFRAAAALPVPLGQLTHDHPLRRLLKSGSVLHTACHVSAPTPRAVSESTATAAASTPIATPAELPRNHREDARHAARVAAYYDVHTEPFYLSLWDGEDIHFGLFDEPAMALGPALKAMTRALVAPAAIRPGEFVLDAGCGVGGAALDLARDYGARVLGVTVSPRQVEIAQARAAERGLAGQVAFTVADCAEHLPAPDASVDVVLTIEAACHFADKARFLRECHRVLKPGGRLVGSDWIRTATAAARDVKAALAAVEDAWHLASLASLDEWRALFGATGFEILQMEDFGARVWPNNQLIAHARLDLLLEMAGQTESDPTQHEWSVQYATLCAAWSNGGFGVGRFGCVKRRSRAEAPSV